MSYILPDNYEDLKKLFDSLVAQREILEIEADAIHSELTSDGPNGEKPAGVKDSLVDEEGFPRGDIDIFNVRNKRHRLAEINTDHKEVMKQLEQIIPKLTQLNYERHPQPPTKSPPASEAAQNDPAPSSVFQSSAFKPIAILDQILEGSPAFTAGIKQGDELIQFGNITAEDSQAFGSIAKLVGESISQSIPLKVRRKGSLLDMNLVPRTWGGRGLLGCHLSPIK
jgi:26S proteasome non-ATPase regulatory subunit 9